MKIEMETSFQTQLIVCVWMSDDLELIEVSFRED